MGNGRTASRPDAVLRRASGGFSLIELLLVISVLVTALLVFSRTMGFTARLSTTNRETALAADAARETIERLRGSQDASLVFALFNADPGDDPPGGAPGAGFAVPGLEPAADDPDGLVGEIRFPTVAGGAGLELRENVDDPILGMPRDLNGDGEIDEDDHGDDYLLLPVCVTLRWNGRGGVRTLEVQTLLADR